MDKALSFSDLSYAYASGVPVFEQLAAELHGGQLVALMGGNGSGKTTLLKCLSGLLPGYEGSIRLENAELARLKRRELARGLSLVPQECPAGFDYLVRDMVLMGRAPYIDTFSTPSAQDAACAAAALAAVGLDHFGGRRFAKLSGGERQLVLIARALAQDTPVMLLDEPTSHLDFGNQTLVMRCLRRLVRERGLLVVMATHDPNLVLSFADRVVLLHAGRLMADGAPDAVLSASVLQELYGVMVGELRQDGRLVGLRALEQEA